MQLHLLKTSLKALGHEGIHCGHGVFITLYALLKLPPSIKTSLTQYSLAVHKLQRVQYFWRWFHQTLVEFGIRTLFCKRHFCLQRMRTTTIYWHALSWKTCTANIFHPHQISHHICFYVTVNPIASNPGGKYQHNLPILKNLSSIQLKINIVWRTYTIIKKSF